MYKNILVIAPLELRIQRVMHRDNATKEQVEARINKQMRDEEKMNLADYIIINDESISLVEQVLTIHRNILSL
jgi:dephospho-CoA kinase